MTHSSVVTLGGGTPAIDISRGEGLYVWDSSGNRYMDCTSQSWALYLGHSNEELRQHASATMDRLWHVHQGFATQERETFAADLLDLVPDNANRDFYNRVAYTATSALAIETAIKLCILQGTNRNTIARLTGGFHGTTLGTAQASWPANSEVSPDRRTLSSFRGRGGTFATLTFPVAATDGEADNADDDMRRHIDLLDAEIDELSSDLLAVIVEPIQGSGGQRILPKWWMRHLCQRADRDGFFVIFDEIQTYMRAGRYFTWADELRPHFIVLGKGLCGGFAAGAVLLRSDQRPFPSGGVYDLHTFATSALAHSVGSKLIEIVRRDDLLANANHRGHQIKTALGNLETNHSYIRDVRQVGLHIGIEFSGGNSASTTVAASMRQRALKRGLLLGLGGYDPNVLKIKPPLTITSAEAQEVASIIADVLEEEQ